MPEINQPFRPYKHFIGSFIPNVLLQFGGLSSTAKIVWGRLAQHEGKNGVAKPKIKTLAKEVALSESQTQRLLTELETKGFIRRNKPAGHHRLIHRPDSYDFLFHQCFDGHVRVSGPSVDAASRTSTDAASNRRDSGGREAVLKEAKAGETSSPAAVPFLSSGVHPNPTPASPDLELHQPATPPLDIPLAAPVPPDRPPYLPHKLPLDHPVCQVLSRFAEKWFALSQDTLYVTISRAIKETKSCLQTIPLPELLKLVDLWFEPGLSWVTEAERGVFHSFIQPRSISELQGMKAGLSTLKPEKRRSTGADGHHKPLAHKEWKKRPSGEYVFTS